MGIFLNPLSSSTEPTLEKFFDYFLRILANWKIVPKKGGWPPKYAPDFASPKFDDIFLFKLYML